MTRYGLLQRVIYSCLPFLHALAEDLPTVKLDYLEHQASPYNGGNNFYNFSNIRYAAPPVGELRFAPPVRPSWNQTLGVQNGSNGHICPQALPNWFGVAVQGLGPDAAVIPGAGPPPPSPDEDCLFLDVIAPKKSFGNNRATLPVIVYIHGGGWVSGYKTMSSDPSGLLQQGDVIYVALNYRLGAFGYLAGDSSLVANVGQLDQLAALEWVQQYIHLFGGDPNQVTVSGISAGGGSIMFHLTAPDIKGSLFQQAILQSPYVQEVALEMQQTALQNFLAAAQVKSVSDAKKLPQANLSAANAQVVAAAAYGQFVFGPTIDNKSILDLPGKSILKGRYNKNVKVMVGHNANEGRLFTNQALTTNDGYTQYLKDNFPSASADVLSYINNSLYPAIYDGSQPYKTPLERLTLTVAESLIECNTFYLDRAYQNKTYAYIFSVPPAIHIQDLGYTFYENGQPATTNSTIAKTLQTYIIQFTQKGNPNAKGFPAFPQYTDKDTALNLTTSGFNVVVDPTANTRCAYWQQDTYR